MSQTWKSGGTPHFLSFPWDFCLFIFLTFCSNMYQGFIQWAWGKIKANHNLHEQRKTSIRENESIYFYPDRVPSDSEHCVVVVENATSYKINYPLWQESGQCSCQQETKIFRESKQFCKQQLMSFDYPPFLLGRKKQWNRAALLALMSLNPFSAYSLPAN